MFSFFVGGNVRLSSTDQTIARKPKVGRKKSKTRRRNEKKNREKEEWVCSHIPPFFCHFDI